MERRNETHETRADRGSRGFEHWAVSVVLSMNRVVDECDYTSGSWSVVEQCTLKREQFLR
jgi:hypothetical protein